MGTKQSSLAKSPSKEIKEETPKLDDKLSGERGLNEIQTDIQNDIQNEIQNETVEESTRVATISFESDESDDESSDEESDTEEDEDFEERVRILEDAKNLKMLATAFLHPETPVSVEPTATARCYFDRPSAPEQETVEEAEYRQQVLEDAAALKQLAIDYAYPEIGVVTTDPTACARCYFDRPSAPEQETVEETEYRQQVLADAAALKQLAVDYAHPEIGVVTTDPTACARCYFDRPSAPEQESTEEDDYRQQVLADAAALKQLAIDYAHPEIGVVTTDPTATARCYFNRPSAPEQETVEEDEYRQQVLADAAALKQLAVDYAHPEIGVVTADPTACARCYFNRPSAPEQETVEEDEYRQQVLADATALKQLAVDYAHPEIGVVTTDPTACARCYFDRPSAPVQMEQKTETPQPSKESLQKQPIIVSKEKVPSHTPTSIKTIDTSKTKDIVRSLSSVQLFGLDGEGDASY